MENDNFGFLLFPVANISKMAPGRPFITKLSFIFIFVLKTYVKT